MNLVLWRHQRPKSRFLGFGSFLKHIYDHCFCWKDPNPAKFGEKFISSKIQLFLIGLDPFQPHLGFKQEFSAKRLHLQLQCKKVTSAEQKGYICIQLPPTPIKPNLSAEFHQIIKKKKHQVHMPRNFFVNFDIFDFDTMTS